MKLGVNALEQLPWASRVALEDLQVQISAGWDRQHKGDGSHGDIVGTSLDVDDGLMSGGPLSMAGPWSVRQGGILGAPQITANQNNYSPTGLADALVLRLQTDASRTLTGLVADEVGEGRWLLLVNVGNFDIVLSHNSGSSIAVNRFACPLGLSFTLKSAESVWLWYDPTSAAWRVVARTRGMTINSIQRFTITFTSGGSNVPTATVTAVDTSKTELRILGFRSEDTNFNCHLELTDSTTVTATRYNACNAMNGIVSGEITEWI